MEIIKEKKIKIEYNYTLKQKKFNPNISPNLFLINLENRLKKYYLELDLELTKDKLII